MKPQTVVDFWFDKSVKPLWFKSTEAFDTKIKKKFESYWLAAVAGSLKHWGDTSLGLIALIIIYDQFPRNMYRQQAKLYSMGDRATILAEKALANSWFEDMLSDWQYICLMPFMHSEQLQHHDTAIQVARKVGLPTQWFEHHRDIIKRFSRFPHRNSVLCRQSTKEELEYLNSNQAFGI